MSIQVLYLSYDGLTDPLGQSQVLPYLTQLSKRGYQFTILSFEKKARFQKEGAVIQALVDTAGIEWVPLSFTAKPPVLSKLWDRWRMQKKALDLHRKKRFSLVHCRSYVSAEVGLKLKQQYGVRMLFDMRGFWADEKVDNGQWPQNKTLYRRLYQFYKKKESDFLLGADGIVSLTQAGKEYLLGKPEFRNLSIDVIPCCADLEHFDFSAVDPAAVSSIKEQLGLNNNDKLLTYLGSVGGWYMTREMFLFFGALHRKFPEYRMLVLTKDDPAIVAAEAAAYGIDTNLLTITYASRTQLPLLLAATTLSIFFIRNTFSKTASSPTKHAELMGMGIPVVCNTIGDTGNIIKATQTGILVDQFDETSLAKAVEAVPQVEQIDKAHIRRAAFDYFDLVKGAHLYASLYKTILKQV